VRRLITYAEQKAAGIIGEHRPQIEHLIEELERQETLDRASSKPASGRLMSKTRQPIRLPQPRRDGTI
jgi:ATP-dependent Zn protease